MKNISICFVGLYEEHNFGDPIIADCTEWLYVNNLKFSSIRIKRLNLDYVEKHPSFLRKLKEKMYNLGGVQLSREQKEKYLIDSYYRYFFKELSCVDYVILVGGGLLKYSYQSFAASISGLLMAAERLHKVVLLNSVGVEGYDENNSRCLQLKKNLHLSCVKAISTRDDIHTLQKGYFDGNPQVPCRFVCDPAVWVSEIYKIKKRDSQCIGIGIGRGGLFKDNGIDYSENNFQNLYVSIVEILINKGYQVELFTNGMDADNYFADKIANILKTEFNVCIKISIPQTGRELVHLISGYKAIVAARLHATIIAYSLNIPAVGFVWNNKLSFFGKNINAEDYFLRTEKFATHNILQTLEYAIRNGYDQDRRKKFRNLIIDDIKYNINNILI